VSDVKYSPAFKWSVIILLPLTIAWKAAVKPENPTEAQDAIVEFLSKQNFDVTVTRESLEYMAIIDAISGTCQLRVMKVSPLGHERDFVQQAVGTRDHSFYVFRGVVYTEQPVWRTVASYLWFRFFRELGLVERIPPVLALISSCEAEQLPWGALGSQEPI
jgi:hypothetical protein